MSHAREEKAKALWIAKIDNDKKKRKSTYYNKQVNKIGSYMINQELYIILRRLPLALALREWLFRRVILNSWYLNRQTKKDYYDFHNFVVESITGLTLDDIEKKNELETMGLKMYQEMRKDLTVEQCEELYLTFARDGVKNYLMSKVSQQNK